MSKNIYKPRPISGFPEWLPEVRIVELQWLDHIRRVFESYGYTSIETPAVEELDVLLAKGETDKEIYALSRLQADEDEKKDSRIGLHFDQTVPFARYTALHFNELDFPFKRYQMQKVWRGERPQVGRMREFLQCDIDVINVDHLPLHFDAEMPAVIYEALEGLGLGRIQIRISNRKILLGFLEGIQKSDVAIKVTRAVDKLEKIGVNQVFEELRTIGISDLESKAIIDVGRINTKDPNVLEVKINKVLADMTPGHTAPLNVNDFPIMLEGIEELSFVLDQLKHLPEHAVTADLSIVRGLDYYTGTVYETRLLDIPEFTSSICSGGRYDDLAGSYINKHLPGVGISIGFTRLFDVLRHHGYIKTGRKTPTDILVVLPSDEQRDVAASAANTLRGKGYNVELYHVPQKLKKQLAYAEKKGIPHVWFPPFEDGQNHEVKDMTSGEQKAADLNSWKKP